jgi:hypothetical protein
VQVVAHDPEMQEFIVVQFGPTPITEDGLDVMCRQPSLAEDRLQQMLEEACSRDPSIREVLKKRKIQRTKRLPEPQQPGTAAQ